MYYLLLLLVIVLITFMFLVFKIDVKNNKKYLMTIFIILTLFLGIRGENVGLDMGNYNEFFVSTLNNNWNHLFLYYNFEIGFKIYTKLITLFTDNFRIYIFITALISITGIYYYIKENSKNYFSSIFIFVTFNYYIYLFCTLRQAMAVSILLLAYNFLKKNNNIKFLLLVILATFFHKTAIVFLVLFLAKKIPYNIKLITIYIVSCLLLFIFKVPLINFFTNLLYSQYIDYGDMSGSGYTMIIFLFAIVIAICYIFRFKGKENNKMLIYMLLLSIPFQILSTEQGLVARIVLYFTHSLIILLPNFIEQFNIFHRNKVKCLYYISLALFFIMEVSKNAMYVSYNLK